MVDENTQVSTMSMKAVVHRVGRQQQQKGEGGGSTVHEGDGQDDRCRLRTGTKRKVDLRQYTEEEQVSARRVGD